MVTQAPPDWGSSRAAMAREAGSPNRRSREYIRWLQAALNRALGLRLAVDGVAGNQTRKALIAFQRRQGLTADGVAGPRTEQALVAVGAPRPPTASTARAATPTRGVCPTAAVNTNTDTLRGNIVRFAQQEWNRWNKGAIKEANPQQRPVLLDYWVTGAGTRHSEPGWWSAHPWSAAFISWVMRKSGAGSAFAYAPAHAVYIACAKQNRLTNAPNPIKAYRVTEVQPRLGDLVCRSRSGSGATYDNIAPGMKTHCDFVTGIEQGRLITIGGNVGDSVSVTRVPINAAGFVSKPGYFAIIRVG
jgi:hypothetical protein